MVFRVTVHLWQNPGEPEAFRRFEDQALDIMRRYGATVLIDYPQQAGGPDEIHHLSFPDQSHFLSYREDAGLAQLADLRQKGVLTTELIWPDGPPSRGSAR